MCTIFFEEFTHSSNTFHTASKLTFQLSALLQLLQNLSGTHTVGHQLLQHTFQFRFLRFFNLRSIERCLLLFQLGGLVSLLPQFSYRGCSSLSLFSSSFHAACSCWRYCFAESEVANLRILPTSNKPSQET